MNEDNIMQVQSMSIILLICMIDILVLYMSDQGCFTFIITHYA